MSIVINAFAGQTAGMKANTIILRKNIFYYLFSSCLTSGKITSIEILYDLKNNAEISQVS